MGGYSDQIFDYLIQLDLYKIDYAKKYIYKRLVIGLNSLILEIKYLQLNKY